MSTSPRPELTGRQRRHLRSLAHHRKPVVQVGKNGLTRSVLACVEEALASHELIKVRLTADDKAEKRQLAGEIEDRLRAAAVGMVGHVAIFYRPAEDAEARRIELPG